MPTHSLTDLAGLRVSAEDLLVAASETAAQPIWVVDPGDVIRFANPAALTALGYDSADELLGRHRHETIHCKHPDGTPYPARDCPLQLPRTTGETVARELDWLFRRDGSKLPVSYVSAPIEMPEGRGAVVAFAEIGGHARAEQVVRERDALLGARLGEEQAALRRVATLAARGPSPQELFAAVLEEAVHVFPAENAGLARYESDGTMTTLAITESLAQSFPVGGRWRLGGKDVSTIVFETGRSARIDSYGLASSVGAPIVVEGRVWGVMTLASTEQPLPADTEARLASFAELVATAIANAESRAGLARLAEEQAALRRVATLVARGVPPEEVLAAVANEVGRLLAVDIANVIRYESDDTVTLVASADDRIPVGSRWPLGETSLAPVVFATGRPARIDNYAEATGQLADDIREQRIRSAVATPIIVEGRVWGQMVTASSQEQPLPPDTEARLASFTELVATAIANTEARSEVAASRARIVAATDEERRRVVRDLHDGAQQRLVHTVITLKLAHRALRNEDAELRALLTEALDHAEQATAELRELVHGILPAVLTQGGLRAGADALASRMPLPVENDVAVGRLPAAVEATAYFVVAEALTNIAKHAHAGHATVKARVEDGTLRVQVRDDGVGGARPQGSGLLGLADRLAALDGRLRIESPADGGTLVAADIPLAR